MVRRTAPASTAASLPLDRRQAGAATATTATGGHVVAPHALDGLLAGALPRGGADQRLEMLGATLHAATCAGARAPPLLAAARGAAFLRWRGTGGDVLRRRVAGDNASCARAALPRDERCVAVDVAAVMLHYHAAFWQQLAAMCQPNR